MRSRIPKIEFVCPTDESHDVKDYEKSNSNWLVTKNPCPVCGKQLIYKIDGVAKSPKKEAKL